jgi:hypothetical protein
MFGIGKAKPPVDADEFDWLLACLAWLTREFGGVGAARPVVLPDDAHYPPSRLTGHPRALELFDQTKAHAGMSDWPCELRAGEADRERVVALGHALRHHWTTPLGTFGYSDDGYFITYNPTSLAHPQVLVATFAHELSHYLLHTARDRAPGGAALAEHATDLGAAFLGFGIFMANSAKSFRQFEGGGEMGWEMRGAGYLSENALITALAMSTVLTGDDTRAIEAELKPYLRSVFRKALAAVRRTHPDLAADLERIDLDDWA